MKKAFLIFGILVVAFLSIYAITKRPFSIPAANWTSVTIGPPTTFQDSILAQGDIYLRSDSSETAGNQSYLDLRKTSLRFNLMGDSPYEYFYIDTAIAYIGRQIWKWTDYGSDTTISIDADAHTIKVGGKFQSHPIRGTGATTYLDFTGNNRIFNLVGYNPYEYFYVDTTRAAIGRQTWTWEDYPSDTTISIDADAQEILLKGKIFARDLQGTVNESYIDFTGNNRMMQIIGASPYCFFGVDTTHVKIFGQTLTVGSYQGFIDTTFMASYSTGVVLKNGRPTSPQAGSTYFSFSGTADPDTGWAYNGSAWSYTLYQ